MTNKLLFAIYAAILVIAVAASFESVPAPAPVVVVAEDPIPQCPSYPECDPSAAKLHP